MMIPTVVFVLGLVTSGLSLPLTTEQQVPTGNEEISQFPKQTPSTEFPEKTVVEGSPEFYSQVEKVQSNPPVPKVENVPVKVENPQTSYPQNQVHLPIQPLAVVPVGQVAPVLQPVIVPAEAITPQVIFKSGIPVQQGGFSEDIIITGNSVPFEEVAQPVTYISIQAQGVEPIQQYTSAQRLEEQTLTEPTGQQYTPTQIQSNSEPLVKEQQVVQANVVPQNVEQVQNYNPVPVDLNTQVYNVPQSVQPQIVHSAEKKVPHQVEGSVLPIQVIQQSIQQVEEKQRAELDIKPAVSGNVEKQVPQQQYTENKEQQIQQPEKQGQYQQVHPETVHHSPAQQQIHYTQQAVQEQGEYQKEKLVTSNSETPVQNWAVNKETYNTQPVAEKQVEYQQVNPEKYVQNWPVEQQLHNTQTAVYQTEVTHPQQQQVHNTQPVLEKQRFYQADETYPQQHQVHSVQQGVEKQGVYQTEVTHPQQQVHNVQQGVEKQGVYQTEATYPQQQQAYNTQQVVEKQGVYQTEVTYPQQQQIHNVQQGVEKQGVYQTEATYPQQQVHNVQQGVYQTEVTQPQQQQVHNTQTAVYHHPQQQQVHNAQPVLENQRLYQTEVTYPQQQQIQNVQQGIEKQGVYQTEVTYPQQQQVHNVQQGVEKQGVYQTEATYPQQQQVYNTQPVVEKQSVYQTDVTQPQQQQVYNTQPVVEKQSVYQTDVTQPQQQQVQIVKQGIESVVPTTQQN